MIVKTMAAARQLGLSYRSLWCLIQSGQLQAPEKDSSGDYVWSGEDLDRARKILEKRRAKEVVNV